MSNTDKIAGTVTRDDRRPAARRIRRVAILPAMLMVALIAFVDGTGPVQAASADAPLAPRQPQAEKNSVAEFLLAPGDSLTITVFDQPDLSGNFLVDLNGQIALPLLGPIRAADRTTGELQSELTSRFGEGYLQNPIVNVRVTELRPVTVVGDVRLPGRYIFTNGMNAGTLISLAGGLNHQAPELTARRAEFLAIEERLSSLRLNRLALLAHRARIDTQLDRSAEIAVPDVDTVDRLAMEAFVADERVVLTAETEALDQQVALLAEQTTQLQADIKAFNEQIVLEQEQIGYLDGQIADSQALLANGLVRKSVAIELLRERSRSRSNLAKLLGDLGRAHSVLAETEFKIRELRASKRSQLIADRQTTVLKLAEIELSLPLVQSALGLAPWWLDPTRTRAVPRLELIRYSDGSLHTVTVEADVSLLPGDLLQVGDSIQILRGMHPPPPGIPGSAEISLSPFPQAPQELVERMDRR